MPQPIPHQTPSDSLLEQYIGTNEDVRRDLQAELGRERDARQKHLDLIWDVNRKVDKIGGDFSEMKGHVLAHGTEIVLLKQRADRVEAKADKTAEDTGQHNIDELQKQLDERKERSRHWVRTLVAAVVIAATGFGSGCALRMLF